MSQTPRPMDEVKRLFEQVNHSVEEMALALERGEPMGAVGAPFRSWQEGYSWVPVDVVEFEDEVVVKADLPGFETDEITVDVSDRVLDIDAEHDEETEETDDDGEYVRCERRHKGISRSIRLPSAVESNDVTASMANGILTVTLPKAESESPEPVSIELSEE